MASDLVPLSPLSRAAQTRQVRLGHAEIAASYGKALDNIYDRYGKNFSNIADEIDLVTGQITINNGHIDGMRHECDTAQSTRVSHGLDSRIDSDGDTDTRPLGSLNGFWQALLEEDYCDPSSLPHADSGIPVDSGRYLSDGDDDDSDGGSSEGEHGSPGDVVDNNQVNTVARLASSLHSEPTDDSVEVNADYVKILAERMATAMEQYMRQQTGGITSRVFLPFSAEHFPLPSVSYMLEGHDSTLTRPTATTESRSLWDSRVNRGYFDERRKRKRVGTRVEPIPIDPALSAAETDYNDMDDTDDVGDEMDDHDCNDNSGEDDNSLLTASVPATIEDRQDEADAAFRQLAFGVADPEPLAPSDSSQLVMDTEEPAYASPQNKRKHFTLQEDRLIGFLKGTERRSWKEILPLFPGRSMRSLQCRWARLLKDSVFLPPGSGQSSIKREIIEIDSDDEQAMMYNTAPSSAGHQFAQGSLQGSQQSWSWPTGTYAGSLTNRPQGYMHNMTTFSSQPTEPEPYTAPGPAHYRRFNSAPGTGSFGILQAKVKRKPGVAPATRFAPTIGACGVILPAKKTQKTPAKRRRLAGDSEPPETTTYQRVAPSFMKTMPSFDQALPGPTPVVRRAPSKPKKNILQQSSALPVVQNPESSTDLIEPRVRGFVTELGHSSGEEVSVVSPQSLPAGGGLKTLVHAASSQGVQRDSATLPDRDVEPRRNVSLAPTTALPCEISPAVATNEVLGEAQPNASAEHTRQVATPRTDQQSMDSVPTAVDVPAAFDVPTAVDVPAAVDVPTAFEYDPLIFHAFRESSESGSSVSDMSTGGGGGTNRSSLDGRRRTRRYRTPGPDSDCDELA